VSTSAGLDFEARDSERGGATVFRVLPRLRFNQSGSVPVRRPSGEHL